MPLSMNKGLYLYQGGQCVSCNVGIVSSTAVSVDEHGKRTVNGGRMGSKRDRARVEHTREREKKNSRVVEIQIMRFYVLTLDEM